MSITTNSKVGSAVSINHVNVSTPESDDVGAIDPTLDQWLEIESDDTKVSGDESAADLDIGQSIRPMRELDIDSGKKDEELDVGAWVQEPEYAAELDDSDGPLADQLFLAIELEGANQESGNLPDESDFPDEEFEGGNFQVLDVELELLDGETVDEVDDTPVDVNDLSVAWSAQPWCEYGLRTAFVPCVNLAGHRDVIVASGDTTNALSPDDLSIIDDAAVFGKSCDATFLDEDGVRVVVVTVTGQLLLWNRDGIQVESDATARFGQIDRAMDIWRATAGCGPIWLRLATGELMCCRNSHGDFERIPTVGRCLAIGGNETILRGLLSHAQRLSLLTVDADIMTTLPLPREMNDLAHSTAPLLVTSGQVVVVGARNFGLWLSIDGGTTFRQIAGCRNVTACTIGVSSGRIHAWAALFFELDDRAELLSIDCKTLRVQKLAEYHVLTDSMGPEDDPPERARIDCLMWDALRQRILAAGCFGLTCFVPPHGPQPAS